MRNSVFKYYLSNEITDNQWGEYAWQRADGITDPINGATVIGRNVHHNGLVTSGVQTEDDHGNDQQTQ